MIYDDPQTFNPVWVTLRTAEDPRRTIRFDEGPLEITGWAIATDAALTEGGADG